MTDSRQKEATLLDYAPRIDRRPWYQRSRVLLPIVGVSIAFGAVVFMWSTPRAKSRPLPLDRVCAMHLGMIGHGLQAYVRSNVDAMPPTLQTLVTEGDISRSSLTCPTVGRRAYIYLPTPTMINDPKLIYAHEPLGMHDKKGANVLFGDGNVQWCTAEDLQHYLDLRGEILARATSTSADQ